MSPREISMGGYTIGSDFRPHFVAEISGNHGGSIEILNATIESIAECQFDFAKIQIFDPKEMAHEGAVVKEGLWEGRSYESLYESTQMPEDLQRFFFTRCRGMGVAAFASVFSFNSLERALKLGACAIKIASPEITDLPLLEAAAKSGLPVIVSLGASSRRTMCEAAEVLDKHSSDWMFMHAVSKYPCPPSEANLGNLSVIQKLFDRPVGYSDHTFGTWASTSAITLGASLIEKHFIASYRIKSEDALFSIQPEDAMKMINDGHRAWSARKVQFYNSGDQPGAQYIRTFKDGKWRRG